MVKSSRRRRTDPAAGPLAGRPFPEVAEALRSRIKPVLREWQKWVRRHVAPANGVGFDQFLDHVPEILSQMADALASGDPQEVGRLMERSPSQGVHRYQIHYDVRDLATEDRMLKRLVVEHVEAALGRGLSREEDTALDWALDLMAQQAMVAFVNHQNRRLREAADGELQYLSFLSHDLSGNLGNVTLWLQVLKRRLGANPQFAPEVEALDSAQRAILDTMGGMGRLLQAERLRQPGVQAKSEPVDLHDLSWDVVGQITRQAEQKGVAVAVEVPAEAAVHTDRELIRIVLQNLVANGVKFSSRGTVRVRAERLEDGRESGWVLSVSDEGPGIAPERLERIFEAFRRGEMHGQQGVGLGLAIASRAAKLLGAELTVESKVGTGSTFRIAFPPPVGHAESVGGPGGRGAGGPA